MQVLLKSSDENVEVRCGFCGKGFVMFWERRALAEYEEILKEVELTLKDHHLSGPGEDVHPDHGFLVPSWDGPISSSAAAVLGNVPRGAL